MISRRRFLEHTAAISAGLAIAPRARGLAQGTSPVALKLSKDAPCPLPPDFLGLGYEMSSVATPGLLSADNERYVHLLQQLGSRDVLRVGGIVANYTRYDPSGTAAAEPKRTVFTQAALEQFAAFLKKLGWTTIWSLNFAQSTLDEAVAEAKAVTRILGASLLAFELGNEVEDYDKGPKPFRKPPYLYETYRAEYTQWRNAILAAVPSARFAAPDTAWSVEWVERMAKDAHADVQLLTTHYYRGDQHKGTPEQLLTPDPHLREELLRLRAASTQSRIPWRMCETNSFYGGGRPGLSDTFLGALWTLDFLLLLAQYGCSGVNLETGVNQLGFISSYSPVQDDGKGTNSAGVPYYGMLAFAAAREGTTEVISLNVPETASGVTAYALGSRGQVRSVVLVHRGSSDVTLSVAGLGLHRPSAMRLSAPAMDSTTGVTFTGTSVDAAGHWAATRTERLDGGSVLLQKMSAVVLRR